MPNKKAKKKISNVQSNNIGEPTVKYYGENPEIDISDARKTINRLEEVKKELQDTKRDFLVIFGIFASFVTFVSIEIQILKTLTNFWLLVGLSSFLLSSLLLFSLSLNGLINKACWKDFVKNPVFHLLLFFFIISIIFFFLSFKIS